MKRPKIRFIASLAFFAATPTIIFALKRDGSLLGKPRITHSHLLGDADAQNGFVRAPSDPGKCLPISITDDLGGAIAQNPLSIRIGRQPKRTDT